MGLAYTEAERRQVLTSIDAQIDAVVDVRELKIPLSAPPALTFDPRLPSKDYGAQANIVKIDNSQAGYHPQRRISRSRR